MPSSAHRLTRTVRRKPVEAVPPLDDLIAQYLANHLAYGRSPKTIVHYQDTFKLFHRFLVDQDIAPDRRALSAATFRQFGTWLRSTPLQRPRNGQRQRSEHGVHGVMKDLRALVRWLYKEELIDRLIEVPVPKVPQHLFPILSNEEMSRVWQSSYMTGRSSMAIRNRALIGLMLDTGIRRAEVCGLTPKDVDFEQSHIRVTGKGNKQRIVPFVGNVKMLLLEWAAFRGDGDGPFFWLQPSGLRMVFRRIQKECDLPLFHPHLLRHQAATEMVRNNIEGARLQIILGHSDFKTTLRYLSLSQKDVREGHAAASPFNSLVSAGLSNPPVRRRRVSGRD